MAKIIDITQRVFVGKPVWPGDTDFGMERVSIIAPGNPVNVSCLTLSPHTGTHMDAPFHYDPDGISAGEVDLDIYMGIAHVIDATSAGALVEPHHIEGQLPDAIQRVLIKTDGNQDPDTWPTGFTAMHADTVHMLAAKGVKLIGIDTPSMDPEDSKDMPAHQAIRSHGIAILESILLNGVDVGTYELIALPLKLSGCDGSPVRAVLRTID